MLPIRKAVRAGVGDMVVLLLRVVRGKYCAWHQSAAAVRVAESAFVRFGREKMDWGYNSLLYVVVIILPFVSDT